MSGTPEPVPELAGGKVLAGRVSASVIDQGLSTGTNLFISLIAAKVLSVHDFGTFGVVYLVAVAVVGAARATLGGTIIIFQSDAARDHGRQPFGVALATGLVTGAGVAAFALIGGGELRLPMLALAVTLPGMLVQDVGRMVEFAELQPVKALVLDVIWAVVMVGALVGVGPFARLTPAILVLIWGGSGTASALWTLWVHGRRVPPPTVAWLRHTWHFAWRYLVVFASTLGVFQVTTLFLGVVSGVSAVAAVQAVQIIFGAIQNLATGLMVAFVPDTTADTPLRDQRKRLVGMSIVLTVVGLTITGVALLLPDAVGEAFLGDSWEAARPLLVPAGLSAALFGVTSGAVIGLRAARAAHESLIVGLQMCAFQLVIPAAGALLGDESGYMWALAITWVLGTVLWWRCYRRIERDGPAPNQGPTAALA